MPQTMACSHMREHIIALFGIMLFVNKSGDEVRIFTFPLLRDFEIVDICYLGQSCTYSFVSRVMSSHPSFN